MDNGKIHLNFGDLSNNEFILGLLAAAARKNGIPFKRAVTVVNECDMEDEPRTVIFLEFKSLHDLGATVNGLISDQSKKIDLSSVTLPQQISLF